MDKISSRVTHFSRKIFPWLILSAVSIISFIYLFLKAPLAFIIVGIFVSLVCLLVWLVCMKNLQTVYLENEKLIMNNEEIHFNKIISIKKYLLAPIYKVKYNTGIGIKSFIFQPKFYLPIFEHSYIKEIKKNIEVRRNNNNHVRIKN